MIKAIANLLIALNGNVKRSQIAAGFAWGVLLGLVPAGNALWVLLFVASFFFHHHHGAKVIVFIIIKLLLGIIDPALDAAGWALLNFAPLAGFFTKLYNMPLVVPLTRFNNTIVAGGLVVGIVAAIVFFILMLFLVPIYRTKLLPHIAASKFVKSIKAVPFVSKISALTQKAAAVKEAVS
jgi:uncharacterized protein (TIGR03546 family)